MQQSPKQSRKDCRHCKICGDPVLKVHKLKVTKIGGFGFQHVEHEVLKPASLKDIGWVCLECQQKE